MKRKFAAVTALLLFAAAGVRLYAVNEKNNSPAGATPPPAKPVPLLTGAEEARTFNLPPGFHAEVVAEEPMVEHPVAAFFDADGRLWVAEMRSYMPDVNGKGESTPDGRISILEDTDGDGRMDKSTVFLDNLVLPRAVAFVRGGALVASPPNVYFYRDTDGDGKADAKDLVATDYGVRGNVEHQPNGLMPAMDNWVYNADYNKRFRFAGGKWIADTIPDMGQWGITQDDVGRLYFNTNSDYLRGNLYAPQYALRNRHYSAGGINVQVAADQNVWPAHDTAVNRGYTKGFLRDGKLAKFTAACAPVIYRADLFPKEFYGNAFVCEPSANVVRRDVVTQEPDGRLTSKNAYDAGTEFIASTYERFRPVNLYTGPDGALYIVDMHHGLIQHTDFLTSYNAADYKQRALNKYLRTGRIFRIVPDGAKPTARPSLSKTASKDLVPLLSHPNGWWRDTAQRLLVERNESSVVPALKGEAKSGTNPLGRLHALWALEGMKWLDRDTVTAALSDSDPRVRAAALRLCEPWLGPKSLAALLPHVLKLESDEDPQVRLQLALTAGSVTNGSTDDLLLRMLANPTSGATVRDAVIGGLQGRELEFLTRCVASSAFSTGSDWNRTTVAALARCVLAEGNPKRVARLLEIAVESDDPAHHWRPLAVMTGIAPGAGKKPVVRKKGIVFTEEPAALPRLRQIQDPAIQKSLTAAMDIIHWPGQPGYTPPKPPTPLTATEAKLFDAGKALFATTCAQCHKPDGMGQAGLAPPLVDSEWVLGPAERPVRIVLHGVRGAINVNGQAYNLEMPGLRLLGDEQIASLLTYIRREWDHDASPVSPDFVATIRKETDGRQDGWTQQELLKIGAEPKTSSAQNP
jgi:mono/diheme cytochrome c family protein/glucose/arabinose dehydrogenase